MGFTNWYTVSDTTAEKIISDLGYEITPVKESLHLNFSDKDSAGEVTRWNQLRWNIMDQVWEMRHEDNTY